MVYNERHNCGKSDQKFNPEVVHFTADGSLVSDEDQVDVGEAADDEEDLNGRVVPGYEAEEDIIVSCDEYKQV